MIRRWIVLTSFILVAVAFTEGSAITFDWDTDANGNTIERGEVIDNEYADWGMNVSCENFVRSYDKAITFDSENPTGDDWDLETGGTTGHDPYGNILIISERDYDGNGDGRIDTPDDEINTAENGFSGYINFDFDFDIVSGGFDLLDIQYDWSAIAFYDDGVMLSDETIWVAPGDDNNMQTVNFSVECDQIRFWFGPGGAIAEMWVTQAPPPVPTPEPATWLFLSSTVAVTAGIYRKKKRQEKD